MSNLDVLSSKGLLIEVENKLKEEKWTRLTIDNYTKKDFEELDTVIEKALDENISEKLKSICIDFLKEKGGNHSIIALYIAGILNYENEIFNDTYMEDLVRYFQKNSKWHIVEFLSNKVLGYGENKFFLTTLEDCYINEKKDLPKLWKRLCQVDYENGETPRKLAQYYERESNLEKSIHYYKMALLRFSKKENVKQIEEIWNKLLHYIPEDLDFFFQINKEISKYNPKKSAILLKSLLPYFENNPNQKDSNEIIIKILKQILHLNAADKEARELLIEKIKLKYSHHNLLDQFIQKSKLNNFSININEALANFEKYILFEKGKFVYHRAWRIGEISQCEENDIFINFETKKGHKMAMQIALFSLKFIEKDHIWIKKSQDLDAFRKLGTNEIKETLIILFKSYQNKITMKEIKKEMVDILGEEKWLKWWNKARQVMKMSSIFGTSQNSKNEFFLRDKPLTFEEEAYINFTSAKKFYKKFEIIQDYLKNSTNIHSEEFREMLNYFVDLCNNSAEINDKVIHIYLFLKKIQKDYPGILFELKLTSLEILTKKADDILEIYNNLEEAEFRRILLKIIKKYDPEWKNKFIYLIQNSSFSRSNTFILEILMKNKDENILKILNQAFTDILANYRTSIGNYFWFVRFVVYNPQFEIITNQFYPQDKNLIFNLFHSLDILNKKIGMKKITTLKSNRKLFSNIIAFLVLDEVIDPYIDSISLKEAKKILAITNSLTAMNSKYQILILKKIFDKYPALAKEKQKRDTLDEILLVTRAGYEKKQKELQYLINVEIPKNSRAIGLAQEKGDLKENAEYSAALEHQKHLQKVTETLSKELQQVKILTEESINTSKISPGNYIEIEDLKDKKLEYYTILGEWETDIEKNIISYRSPFGKSLLGHKVKDTVHFIHGGIEKQYLIKKIEKTDLI